MKVTTMIKQTLLFTSICALFLAGALSVRAADRMAAGQWEFTLTGELVKQCITPDQANASLQMHVRIPRRPEPSRCGPLSGWRQANGNSR